MPADVLIENHGSVALFTPITPEAHQWVEENVHVESWQRMGCSIACDRLVPGVACGPLRRPL